MILVIGSIWYCLVGDDDDDKDWCCVVFIGFYDYLIVLEIFEILVFRFC